MLDLIKSKVAPRVTNLINESPRNLGKEKIMEMNVVFGSNVELAAAIAETLNNDYTSLKEVVAALNEIKRGAKAVADEQAKANKLANKEVAIASGKKFASSLSAGDRVRYNTSKGIVEATVGEQKEGAKTLHVILDEIPEGSKKADRYIGFDKLIIA